MEQYQSITESIQRLKRPMIFIAIIGVLAQTTLLAIGLTLGKTKSDRKYTTFETCFIGMNSLFANNASPEVFQKGVLDDVKGHNFKIEKISLVKVLDSYTCDVVGKDKKGYRSYRVLLEKNSKFSHLYKITDVKGQKLVSNYQWRNTL